MKKYISMLIFALAGVFCFVSCDVETDEEAGGTNVEKMAGFWDVAVDAVDESGQVVYYDPYGLGTISIATYNTASNATDSMWVYDYGNFWYFQLKVAIDYSARTFSCSSKPYYYEDASSANCVITNGKILENQGHNIHGLPCDSITFNITFDDDQNGLIYRISGVRHSGFTE